VIERLFIGRGGRMGACFGGGLLTMGVAMERVILFKLHELKPTGL
jgi:hypothetical protein